jgi:hypothetical protein
VAAEIAVALVLLVEVPSVERVVDQQQRERQQRPTRPLVAEALVTTRAPTVLVAAAVRELLT